jgi:hypothetical protein
MDVTEHTRTAEALLEVNRTLEAQAALLQSQEELLKIFVTSVPAGVAMRSHYELFPDVPEHWKEMHRRDLEGETLRARVPLSTGSDSMRVAG